MTRLGSIRRVAIATALVVSSALAVVAPGPGTGPAAAAPGDLPADASVFVPIRPCRIADTRTGPAPAPHRNHTYEITGHCGVPTHATAVTATITITDPPAPGYLRAWATGDPEPTGSFLNYKTPRTSTTGSGPIPLSTTGTLDLRTYTTTATHLVLDITGYHLPLDTPSLPADASVFVPIRPCRIADTRTGPAPAPHRNHTYEITGHCGVPTHATAVTATITITDPPAPGYLRAWATGDPEPTGSFLNYKTPRTSTTGSGPIPLSTTGTLDLRTYTTTATHLVLDITGHLLALDAPAVSPPVALAAGAQHTCLLRADGTVACWGDNDRGQLGIGTRGARRTTPVDVVGIAGATQITAGGSSTCARLADGTARCWGDNQTGQLGNGTVGALGEPTPVTVVGLTGAASVSMGSRHACARLADGTARCWGDNYWGQLGDGNVTEADEPETAPVTVVGLSGVTSIAAGANHSCASRTSGAVTCWGANDLGQLGIGGSDLDPHPLPEPVLEVIDAVEIVAGSAHTCARIGAGSVDCWGANASGQLGREYVSSGPGPSSYPVTGLQDAVGIALGYAHSCAIRTGGTVVCWGDNDLGQLGDGTTIDHNLPAPMIGIAAADAVAAGDDHTCVLAAGGVVRCRGTGWADPVPT